MAERANATIKDVLRRRSQWSQANYGIENQSMSDKDRELLRQAADELDVAADLREEAGALVSAGTLHKRADHARRGDYRMLAVYD